ncbi:MAG: nitrous oxide reductase family maturation protein NosD [Magnetococcus sp. WYHC-3]
MPRRGGMLMAGVALLLPWSMTTAEEHALPLQPLIDAATPGSVLQVPPGRYRGPVRLDKPLTLEGAGAVTVDGGGKGTVMTITADSVTLRGLHIRGSGQFHNDLDACVHVRASRFHIEGNRMSECLFGIDVQQANDGVVRNNDITSHDLDLGLRGDAIRLWYARNNRIEANTIHDSRDVVIWYSAHNVIAHNRISGGRYSVHFMYAQDNHVENNVFDGNAVGIFLMYSSRARVAGNLIRNAAGSTGLCLGLKDTSEAEIIGNRMIHCSAGIYLDQSPYDPDTTNLFQGNHVGYNSIGVQFHMSLTGNRFRDNNFISNLTPVAVDSRGHALDSQWEGNYWDTFEGFDADGDGIGDTPFEAYLYADLLWMDHPNLKFFHGSPVLAVLDFLERLAPFSNPQLLLRDTRPRMSPLPGEMPHG